MDYYGVAALYKNAHVLNVRSAFYKALRLVLASSNLLSTG